MVHPIFWLLGAIMIFVQGLALGLSAGIGGKLLFILRTIGVLIQPRESHSDLHRREVQAIALGIAVSIFVCSLFLAAVLYGVGPKDVDGEVSLGPLQLVGSANVVGMVVLGFATLILIVRDVFRR